ncbi:unnamed protein product [Rhizoctonia solani]|uniref:F-box domain-containing protein n=1 Tax=Rhizoctonia solani TaxID=456999 RepID=A0A8H3HMT1_9AGAM|nr:unnamed protein product [Rhizoctonia solani]
MRTRRQTQLLEESGGTGELFEHTTRPPGGSEQDNPADLTHNGPPPRKKRVLGTSPKQTKAKATNKITGGLSEMLYLPIEVFIEIIRHLALPDVLSLSRSNKFFRQTLMTRSAASLAIWRAAVENVPGLPPCPKDLCEPQYAALIYSKHCSMCGTSVVKRMDPYLNVRLCKDCIELQFVALNSELDLMRLTLNSVTHVDELEDPMLQLLLYQSTITRKKTTRHGMKTCLVRDLDKMNEWFAELLPNAPYLDEELRAKVMVLFDAAQDRIKYANSMDIFLRDMAEVRNREIEQLKERRRQDVKRRLEKAGWEEPDWTFPDFVARKWALLVDGCPGLTERGWQKLYPNLVPYLEKNRESHQERSRIIRKGKRLRRIRRLLLGIRNATNLLEVDGEGLEERKGGSSKDSTGVTTANDTVVNTPSASEHDSDDTKADFDGDADNLNGSTTISPSVTIRAPFPPMVDLLKWPIIVKLLEADTDADTMQGKFEALKNEIQEQIQSWRSTVEKELVCMLEAGTTGSTAPNNPEVGDQEVSLDTPLLELQIELPARSHSINHITSATQLLLRADSVFRASEDTVAPLPLYFPELFHILQDRPDNYFSLDFQKLIDYERPQHGHTWDPSEVVYYPEGAMAAKALLRELGLVDAPQYELQTLGARFTCGSCADSRLRTWNEMVQHYAEATAHASIAEKAEAFAKKQVKYKNVHSLDIGGKSKRKRKPLVTLHSIGDAKILLSTRPRWENLVRCNLCVELGVEFQSPRDVMRKHVQTGHSQAPKAEHYENMRMYDLMRHIIIGDPMGAISDSTEATDQEMVEQILSNHSNHGQLGVHWSYHGSHHDLHPGWDREDF